MSPLEHDAPPAGEEIHLPGPTKLPIMLAVSTTIALVGITISPILLIAGGIATVVVLILWIADARREYAELPADHSAH